MRIQFKRQACVAVLVLASAFAISACSTMEEATAQASSASAASGTSGTSAVGDPLAAPPHPQINGYTFETPHYDNFEQNEFGFHQYGHRGARCLRLSEAGTCVWWLA